MKSAYIILSTERRMPNGFFVAIHGYSPFYSTKEKAKRFSSYREAYEYAMAELFTVPGAFVVCNLSGIPQNE